MRYGRQRADFFKMFKHILVFIGIFTGGFAIAQKPVENSNFTFPPNDTIKRDTLIFNADLDISEQLLPLDTIFEIAYTNSPSVKVYEHNATSKYYNYRYTRFLWLQGVSGFYNYSYGDQSVLVANTAGSTDNLQIANGYRVGVNVSVSVLSLFGQHRKNKALREEYVSAQYQIEEMKRLLRREIQRAYVDMIEAQRKMRIRTADANIAYLSFKVAENEMQQGKIDATEYSRLSNIYTIAQINLESERAAFLAAFLDFETLVGVEMKYLKKQQTATEKPTEKK